MENCFQSKVRVRLDKHMHMVVHHDIGAQTVTQAVKMAKLGSDQIPFAYGKIAPHAAGFSRFSSMATARVMARAKVADSERKAP